MTRPTLPQQDPQPDQRLRELARAREVYRYDHDAYPPLALAAEVPKSEEPTREWNALAAERTVRLAINSARLDATGEHVNPRDHDPLRDLILAGALGGMKGILEKVDELVKTGHTTGRADELSDFADLFREIELPAIAGDFREDATFAEQRLSGANPMWIRRLSEPLDHFPVTEAHYGAATAGGPAAGDTLAAALAEGRLYLADYSCLEGAACGTFPAGQKYLAAPLALFASPPASAPRRGLLPIAIQCAPSPGPGAPIVTPRDGQAWLIAKTRVQTADGNCHQAISHLGHTHMPLEAFTLATHRQLSARHPLFVLLAPHCEGTLSINESANVTLLAPQGGVDMVLAGTIETSRAVAAQAAASWDFDARVFPTELAARGVDDAAALPGYAYRDDGLLIWGALREWVETYLHTYYPSDAEVQADRELQAWCAEVSAQDGGRIKGFATGGRIASRDYLVTAVTHMIFTASAVHAAVNFPQFTAMAYVPNWPLASYTPPGGAASEQAWFDLLPPLEAAHMQLSLGYLLGTLHYTELGHYKREHVLFDHFRDARVRPAAKAFKARLDAVEETITQRNGRRAAPYIHLLPSRIPQSINI
ncbi:MAG: lipoxygenase family protein [Planctomycetota bacterium]